MNDNNEHGAIAGATLTSTSEALGVAEQLFHNVAGTLQAREVRGAHFVMKPPGYEHVDITGLVEKAQFAPNRKRGVVTLKDIPSFIAYIKDQAAQGMGYVFANPDTRTITAVLNDGRAGAGWRDLRAVYKAEFTPEFDRWITNNGAQRAKGQTEFAEFIEDNLADLREPYAQQLLTVATTIQATSGIEFKSAKRLQDGQSQILYVENIDAKAGAAGDVTIPREFDLGLRIFKNGGGYQLKARLKYRLHSGTVKFWYELDRPERAIEDAFAGYVQTVAQESGYVVLLGEAGNT